MTDPTDRLYECVLVLRCQAGDQAAFAELVERYQPRLRYYLRKMLRQGDEDALQETWMDVFRALPRLNDVGAFRAWLYQIARSRALRELRKRPLIVQSVLDADVEEKDEDFTAEDVERIHIALDELAEDHREVLVLRYVEDMSYEEIAGITACELGTVRSRLHYAKRALRKVMERTNTHE